MKIKPTILAALTITAALLSGSAAVADGELLEGDTRLACEAILCLSTGSPPGECSPSLDRYFGIEIFDDEGYLDWSATLEARLDFLNQCPAVDEKQASREMHSLTDAIVHGARQCDAKALNRHTRRKDCGDPKVCGEWKEVVAMVGAISDSDYEKYAMDPRAAMYQAYERTPSLLAQAIQNDSKLLNDVMNNFPELRYEILGQKKSLSQILKHNPIMISKILNSHPSLTEKSKICVNWVQPKRTVISKDMPKNCLNYVGHEYTDFSVHYVGDECKGGKWVD